MGVKDALFAYFLSKNTVFLDPIFTEFQLMRIKPGPDHLTFVVVIKAKAEKLSDCGFGDIEDSIIKTKIYRDLTGRQNSDLVSRSISKLFQVQSSIKA